MTATSTLLLRAEPAALAALTPLAREGLGLRLPAGRTLRETLTLDLNLCPDCVEERIQTVFLDGSPVDDIDADHIRPGCTLALAGALPGVAGIAMRRGSPVGVYREGITHRAEQQAAGSGRDLALTLKLFNSVAVECLAKVLAHGVFVRAGRLAELFASDADALAGVAFELDGHGLARAELAQALAGGQGQLFLRAALTADA
jgi:hypothetical protein